MPEVELYPLVGVSVAVRPSELAETTTKPSPVPLSKHSSGGCTIDLPRRTVFGGGIVLSRNRAIVCMANLNFFIV